MGVSQYDISHPGFDFCAMFHAKGVLHAFLCQFIINLSSSQLGFGDLPIGKWKIAIDASDEIRKVIQKIPKLLQSGLDGRHGV